MIESPFSKAKRDFTLARTRYRDESWPGSAGVPQSQLIRVREVWRECVTEIPYYGRLVESGQAPREINSWADLRLIPVLSRIILQEHPDEFVRRSGPPAGIIKTAGSTGNPLCIGVSNEERDLMRIVKLATWHQFGYTPESRLFLIWGHSHLLGTGWQRHFAHARRKLADFLLGYRRVDAYRLNRELCRTYAQRLIRFRPMGLIGYASALDLFARYTLDLREEFHKLEMRFVLATSEMAPRADTLEVLSDLFGCPVIQEYGGAEFGQIAVKTGEEPFRVFPDLNYVEYDPRQADERGPAPVLVTSLYPRYLPLVRYEVGDAVDGAEVLENGHVASFVRLAGRINDVVSLGDGNSIHSVAIFHCIHQEPDVHNIQMVLADDDIEIRLVSTISDRSALEKRIRGRLTQVHPILGSSRITFLEDLETNRAGKRRWFVDRRSVRGTPHGVPESDRA